jgi:hypothetical protein
VKASSVLDVQSFRATSCDIDHYLVVVEETIAVTKQGSNKFHMERFNLKKLNEVGGKEKYHVVVSNRFSALEDSNAEVEINTLWEMIRETNFSQRESRLL